MLNRPLLALHTLLGFFLGLIGLLVTPAAAQTFRVSAGPRVADAVGKAGPGRVVVFLVRPGSSVAGASRRTFITDFFEEDPQPIFGIEVTGLSPASPTAELTAATPGFLGGKLARGKIADLPPGKYQVQAVFVTRRVHDWSETEGNFASEVLTADLGPDKTIDLPLTRAMARKTWPKDDGFGKPPAAEEFEVRSKLLSDFSGRDVVVRVGVKPPPKLEPGRNYAAVYDIPGFGGDHFAALWPARSPSSRALAEQTFRIVLDPSSPNGHTLFCDSDNNGPWGKALTTEIIPALEAKYPLLAKPEARLLRGHSSGGWSTLWLATEYPEVFGATWSTSPDPIDFRRFELVDIYARSNMFEEAGTDTASARIGGKDVTMTLRQEFTMEDVFAPNLLSGKQWTSWMACWGTRRATGGGITPLFDAVTGAIDRKEAETYRRFDIGHRLRTDPKRFVPIFRNNVRIIVGTIDDYYLNEAVKLVAADLDRLDPSPATQPAGPDGRGYAGYIRFVEGTTHGTVLQSPAAREIPDQMLSHLRATGVIPTP